MKKRVNNFVILFLSRVAAVKKIKDQDGSAMVIALLIMILLMGFVALAISRTTSETIASSNDAAESRAFDAAHASLELMTRNFNKIFEVKLNPDITDEMRIEGQYPPLFDLDYDFTQVVQQTDETRSVILTEGLFQGLTALRDGWQFDTLAVDRRNGVTVPLRRNFFNNRIPIFQFGIFYEDDLEFHPGPRFDFGGRVHSNGSLFLAAATRLNFDSRVSAKNYIFTDVQKNGTPVGAGGDNVWIRNASGTYVQLPFSNGSVLQNPVNGTVRVPSPAPAIPLPVVYDNANWPTNEGQFGGNLLAGQRSLDLPLRLNSTINNLNLGLVELVRRGKDIGSVYNDGFGTVDAPNIVPVTAVSQDDRITQGERYFNKTGMRVHLADSKAKLPGCADPATGNPVAGRCGIRLDGSSDGQGPIAPDAVVAGPRGYLPPAMTGGIYQATRINGERFYVPGRGAWIKIETVIFNAVAVAYDVVDITEDILSMGVTEAATDITTGPIANQFTVSEPGYTANRIDTRSIIKLQRFMFGGAAVPKVNVTAGASFLTTAMLGGTTATFNQNFVGTGNVPLAQNCNALPLPATINSGFYAGVNGGFLGDNQAHWLSTQIGAVNTTTECIAPFPINMFDTREGLYNDTVAVFNPTAAGNYGAGAGPGPLNTARVPWAGVMSMVDIDVANLKRFLDGNFDGGVNPGLPAAGTPFSIANGRALRSDDIPQPQNIVPKSGGWVLYVSDRRGDFDFDGEYDMEDVYGPNDGNLQLGEDANQNNILEASYARLTCPLCEAVRYTGAGSDITTDIAAVFEHRHFRRGVRLINGQTIPGFYDTVTPTNTRGFSVASENGVYVRGNYNATGIDPGAVGIPIPSTGYLPASNTAGDVPASIAADAVTILSNSWSDAVSFSAPFNLGARIPSVTYTRFAMLTGDTQTTLNALPNQGGGDSRRGGGVHNFKRFLERWNGTPLYYSGSLINLFNSHNNNAPFKCCFQVYTPPTRNWVFDATFLDINRIPPGTPFFQSIQITGFQRVNS